MNSLLNWQELHQLIEALRPQIIHRFVDRVFIPERPDFSSRFLKDEWALKLTGHHEKGSLFINLHPHQTYITWRTGQDRTASQATCSPFILALKKHLTGKKVLDCQTVPQERIVLFYFSQTKTSHSILVLHLIPSMPEGFLIMMDTPFQPSRPEETPWPIISQHRTSQSLHYHFPLRKMPAPSCTLRSEFLTPNLCMAWNDLLEKELQADHLATTQRLIEKQRNSELKQIQKQISQAQKAQIQTQQEPDWQLNADLLKEALDDPHSSPQLSIALNPALSRVQQMQLFYKKARQKKTRLQELSQRLAILENKQCLLQTQLPQVRPEPPSFAAKPYLSFLSKDQWTLHVGRNKTENHKLTFQIARGNDLWIHVRHHAGAHVILLVPPHQSPPLDTLLDAAHLAIFYSGGKNWGKTEVDYTFKKYVKKIKDSEKVQYTHEKTLLIDIDPHRMNRLLKK